MASTQNSGFNVELTRWARQDIQDISRFLLKRTNDPQQVLAWLDELHTAIISLSDKPERGHWVQELLAVGMKTHRELLHKPYRIIYQIRERKVVVFTIIDSRRDLQTLLKQRLLAWH